MPKAPPFRPVITATKINTPGAYDYVPSAAAGRIFWCCGLGTDSIVSAPLPGRKGTLGVPFHRPGRLVADPAAVWTGDGWLVFYTDGDEGGPTDGRRNGIRVTRFDGVRWSTAPRWIIPASTNPASYGNGQPSVAALPGDRYHLIYRSDGTDGSELRSALLDSSTLEVLGDVPFAEPEDGASPEAFYLGGRLHVLLLGIDAQGRGWAGIRRYDQWLHRARAAETAYPITGGSFHALPGAVPITNGIDGAGIVRNAHNDPVVRNGRLTVWRGWRDSLTRSPDWRLVRFTIPVP